MAVSDAYNFRQVDERLSTSGVIGKRQLAELAAEGYQSVINLLPDDSPYSVPGESDIVEGQGLAYTYIPVDFAAPSEGDYRQFASAMQAYSDRRMIVHCAANYRVSAFYALYGFEQLGWDSEQVYRFIGDMWDLGDHPVWEAYVAGMLERLAGQRGN